MSKKKIPAEPGGTALSANIQRKGGFANINPLTTESPPIGESAVTVNGIAFTRLVADELLVWAPQAVDTLDNLATSLTAIQDLADKALQLLVPVAGTMPALRTLHQVVALARLLRFVADDTSAEVETSVERFRAGAEAMGVQL